MDDRDDSSYARAPEPDDLIRICRSLNDADVRDTDIREHVVVRVADEVVIDLMGRACGLSYAEVAADAEQRQLGDALVPVALTNVIASWSDRQKSRLECRPDL